ncbi:uncharacterized protein ACNLHF_025913 [Anomaloglossus baeobatrachus]|uniref:uncharacterized protein LOC142245669 n=1 Tax=Anomaloglossus baeobatrachus TaxID=238106 RepID=UPI003F50A1F9
MSSAYLCFHGDESRLKMESARDEVNFAVIMPKRQNKVSDLTLDLTPSSLHLLKRAQLQHYCKKVGLKGVGKNTELIQRLQEHLKKAESGGQNSPRTPPPDKRDVTPEAPAGGRGWCVIHGQELTIALWYQLSLRCGRACVTLRGSYIPLHLAPSSVPTPPGLPDNLICEECMSRNQEKDDHLHQKSAMQDKSFPDTILQKSRAARASRSCKRSGRFQPQEDPEYARRVDELLNQMASGQVDSQKVLQSIRPAVIHSPLGKQEQSPFPIMP